MAWSTGMDGIAMASGTGRRGVVIPTVAAAVAASATMIVINFATEFKTNPWWWLAVGAATALVAGVALWLDHRNNSEVPDTPAPAPRGGQVVNNSTIQGPNFQVGGDMTVNRDRKR